ncbi:MAG: anhydro-N-acetylmuramic acid kinase [Bdellovibrionales bacterium]|nr:anhydro-N-acetylmuramic acid kinase [Bdellovibrionales bacterium]
MKKWLAVGVMSGTSMDGIDAALISVQQTQESLRTQILSNSYQAYSPSLRARIREIIEDDSMIDAAYFGALWSEITAKLILKMLKKEKVSTEKVDVVGVHGQTLFHAPRKVSQFGIKLNMTIQAADLSRLAIRTGIRVVGNFRSADLAAGGEGAPLAPHAHRFLFDSKNTCTMVQNMGGIGNITVLKNNEVALAFDTGPGNIWLDTITRWHSKGKLHYDRNGLLAKKGSFHKELYKRLLDHPYFLKKPPKSTGWELLGENYLRKWKKSLLSISLEDALHTASVATVDITIDAYDRHVLTKFRPKGLIVCGGGAKNSFLMHLFKEGLPKLDVKTSDEWGIPCDHVEASSFALLAIQTLRNQPNNEPKATGAKRRVVCGLIANP